jgi:hypothetical protein
MTGAEFALTIAIAAGIVALLFGQYLTLKAVRQSAEAVKAASRRLDDEMVPLLRESRATVAAARDAMDAIREVAVVAQEVGPVLQDVRPVVAGAGDAVREATAALADARVTLAETRDTVRQARRTIANVDALVRKLGIGEMAVDFIKTRAGGIGAVAAGVGGLVKSVLQRHPREADKPSAEGQAQETVDGTERPFGEQ